MLLRRINGKKVSPTPRHKHPQSHNGAIAAVETKVALHEVALLSIPQWCDCCGSALDQQRRCACVSIPQWCDCCPANSFGQLELLKFQSHNGAIAAEAIYGEEVDFESFNPTMVRLLLSIRPVRPQHAAWFQSHNGAIAAPKRLWTCSARLCFNPTMVRLLRL